ncbi:NmrA family NAD(P)-binding protein, partial [Rhodococcus erythropolis]|nr:NmrA family NAD(P)-binding protein [Rhodococcus erythropolis]
MTKVVIAGGTGALGRRISDDLADRGYDVVVLTRSPKPGRHRQVQWDGVTVGDWAGELDGAAVINLAGELVDRRPTPANIALLTNSRVGPTRALVEASKLLAHPVPVWI